MTSCMKQNKNVNNSGECAVRTGNHLKRDEVTKKKVKSFSMKTQNRLPHYDTMMEIIGAQIDPR